jgi:predicted ABC-type ATPase
VSEARPSVVILAGPNGAGKSTVAPALLHGALAVNEFVNADVIERGLSAFDPESVAIAAGRVMLTRLHELAHQRVSFAFETTLASRSFAPWLRELGTSGYDIHMLFLWLPSADFARRRYRSGLRNFFSLYEPLVSTWRLYDGSGSEPRLIANRLESQPVRVYDEGVWSVAMTQGRS